MRSGSRACSSASVAVEALLGMQPSNAGVDVGLLILVDPSRRNPFWQPVGVDPAAPTLLQEMGVVISAKQGQIIKIGKTTEKSNPGCGVGRTSSLDGCSRGRSICRLG
jgi:hypothetical protein